MILVQPVVPEIGWWLGIKLKSDRSVSPSNSLRMLGDLDDVRTSLRKAKRAATLIYAHFKNEFGLPEKK